MLSADSLNSETVALLWTLDLMMASDDLLPSWQGGGAEKVHV